MFREAGEQVQQVQQVHPNPLRWKFETSNLLQRFCNAKRFHTQLHVESVSRCEAGEDHLQSRGKRLLFLDVDGVLHPLKAGNNSSIGCKALCCGFNKIASV